MLFLVTKRGLGDKFSDLLSDNGVKFGVMTHGKGTAPTKILDILGIGESEYDVSMSLFPSSKAEALLEELHEKLREKGSGIAFTVPTDGYINNKTRKKIGLELKENNSMEINETPKGHSLIVVIINGGYSEETMDIARNAGATGGTVIHARGTGPKSASTFFGITIQPEKDMILIVSPAENVAAITEAIGSDESLKKDAHPVSFSLPVNGLAGFGECFFE